MVISLFIHLKKGYRFSIRYKFNMSKMEFCTLDITVVAASDLKDVNLFMKMAVYVEVYISSEHEESSKRKRKTHMDRSGGCYPEWNHRFKFTVERTTMFKSFINFHLKAESGLGDKVVGVVCIPLRDLLEDSIDNKTSHEIEAEYQVMTPEGKAKGSLKISFRFGENSVQQVQDISTVGKMRATVFPDIYQPRLTNRSDHLVANGGYYSAPYAFYSQPGMVPVPPGYSYPGYGGGEYMYDLYPQTYYSPPLGGYSYPAGLSRQPVAYAYMPVQQPNPVQEQSFQKNIRLGPGSITGMGLRADMLGGFFVGDSVSEAGNLALKEVAVADSEEINFGEIAGSNISFQNDVKANIENLENQLTQLASSLAKLKAKEEKALERETSTTSN